MNFGDLRRGGRAGLLDVGCHQSALVSTLCFAMFGPLCTLFANLINAAAEGSCDCDLCRRLLLHLGAAELDIEAVRYVHPRKQLLRIRGAN